MKKSAETLDKQPLVVYHNNKDKEEVRKEFKHRCTDGENRVIHACYIRLLLCYHNTGFMKVAKRHWVRVGSWCSHCGFMPSKNAVKLPKVNPKKDFLKNIDYRF